MKRLLHSNALITNNRKTKSTLALLVFIFSFTISVISWRNQILDVLPTMTSVHIPRVIRFSENDVIGCIENLVAQRRAKKLQLDNTLASEAHDTVEGSPLHIAFIGDSRIRQHYFSFLQVLPQHDLKTTPDSGDLHIDRQTTSEMLNLLVTFSWRPNILGKIGDNVTETVQRWISTPHLSKKPDFVLIGMALHDMLVENGANHDLYRKRLLKLRPLLDEVNKSSRVMWLSVYPTYDTVSYGWKSTQMFTEKIRSYNDIAREIFSGSSIYYWESSTPVTEEYIRACAVNHRDAGILWGITPYTNCGDYLHPGNVALAEATQMFLNEICTAI